MDLADWSSSDSCQLEQDSFAVVLLEEVLVLDLETAEASA